MLTPYEFIAQSAAMCDEMLEYEKRACHAVSLADKAVSDIYHKMEITRFNAAEGYWFAKQLKQALLHRRAVKMELERLQLLTPFVKQMVVQQQELIKRISQREAVHLQYLQRIDSSANLEVAATHA